MKIRLVFDDWRKRGISVYNTEPGFELSIGNFHCGTIFNAEIEIPGDEAELARAIAAGYEPCFYAIKAKEKP